MTEPLNIACNHMAPSLVIRQRLESCTDLEAIGDAQMLDHANNEGHPDAQALYVEFAGELSETAMGVNHVWRVWLVQRRDMPDWELAYGKLRASVVNGLDGWQPGSDVDSMHLLRDRCGIEDYPGLRVDLISWRVSEIKFTR